MPQSAWSGLRLHFCACNINTLGAVVANFWDILRFTKISVLSSCCDVARSEASLVFALARPSRKSSEILGFAQNGNGEIQISTIVACRSKTLSAYSLSMTASLDPFRSRRYFHFGKEFVGENRSLDRILRRLKLHAEGCQFGGPNP